jgi:hypothetical protein
MHCKREERITSENGHGFAERDVNRRPTSSHEIVVKSWKIIMNETECMHHFDGSCCLKRILCRSANRFTALQSEQGSKSFSAAKKSVRNRILQVGGIGGIMNESFKPPFDLSKQ